MKKLIPIGLVILFTAFISSCGDSNKNSLQDKKAQLEKLKGEKEKLDTKIADLQKDIAKLDTGASATVKPKLVALSTVGKGDFKHYLELQGSVDAKNISAKDALQSLLQWMRQHNLSTLITKTQIIIAPELVRRQSTIRRQRV